MSDIYYWEKLTSSKLWFSQEENLKKCTSFKEEKGTSYIQGNVYFGIIFLALFLALFWHFGICLFQLSFVYKTVSQISLNLFCSGDKRLLSEFFPKWGWFHEHNERFPNILAKIKFSKTETCFCRWKSNDYNKNDYSCHWKTLVPFCMRKKRPENAFLTLTVDYHKIVKKKQIMPFKTTVNWLFSDIWCYVVLCYIEFIYCQ